MSHKFLWTDARDTRIRRRRAEGASWETIAAELSLAPREVMERGGRIGVREVSAAPPSGSEDPAREPLPAGHPASWDAINAGTVLEGEPYPLRFFRR